ncbi:MAG: glycosyltransferase family 2 protein [Flavobacterium sp.]|nr:MAG: glycosyltransferase family 2 protein [Flavobacterium sp.]
MPGFTVVIPLYNKENYIAATLNSVLAQTFFDFEILVVNDCSTDDSVAVVRKFIDNRIRVVEHTVNKGLSASRNTGIKEAKAKYIAFLDADDLWKPTFLESIDNLIKKFPQAGIYATKYEEVYENGQIIEIPTSHVIGLKKYGSVINHYEANLSKPIYCSSCFCIDKRVVERAGYYNEAITFAEDIDYTIRLNYHYELAFLDESLASYIIYTQNQITHASLKNKVITDFDKYEAAYPDRPDIKKYLDFHRYVTAKLYRISGDMAGYKKMKAGIDVNNLNLSQRILLYAPEFILKGIRKVKRILQKRGLNPTTY